MKISFFQKVALGLGGLVAVGVGAAILASPHGFYALYGIGLSDDASLLNELRAPAGALLGFGALMLGGLVWPRLAPLGLSVGAVLYLSYGGARLLSVALDGWPHQGLVEAAVFELALGLLSAAAMLRAPVLEARPV